LGSLTQSSMLHVRSDYIDGDRISKAMQLVQSTSPSYLLLASLDAARQQMAIQGHALMTRTLQLADTARCHISQIPHLSVLSLEAAGKTPGFVSFDRTRLTVNVAAIGLTGFEADEILHQQLNVTAELPSLQALTFIISLGNTEQDMQHLIQALKTLVDQQADQHLADLPIADLRQEDKTAHKYKIQSQISLPPSHPATLISSPAYSPRQAFFSPTETLPIDQVCDRISAELVCPYPPGIPLLFPGDRITSSALDDLRQIRASGGLITGCADTSLQTLCVVREGGMGRGSPSGFSR
jgi:arginine decarboxylase